MNAPQLTWSLLSPLLYIDCYYDRTLPVRLVDLDDMHEQSSNSWYVAKRSKIVACDVVADKSFDLSRKNGLPYSCVRSANRMK